MARKATRKVGAKVTGAEAARELLRRREDAQMHARIKELESNLSRIKELESNLSRIKELESNLSRDYGSPIPPWGPTSPNALSRHLASEVYGGSGPCPKTACEPAQAVSQVSMGLSALASTSDTLNHWLSKLESALATVLLPDAPRACADPSGTSVSARSPVAVQLFDLDHQLFASVIRLRDLVDRIDLG